MATIYDFKPKFQALLRPLCAGLANVGVTANQVTVGVFLLSLIYGAAIYWSGGDRILLLLLPLFLFVRMALNAIDGMLARDFGHKSKLGAILNELTDVLADAALYLPFAVIPGLHPTLVVVVVLFGVTAEMTGVGAIQIGASRRFDGPFGKSDRALFFGALAFALGAGAMPGAWSTIAFGLAVLLGVVTIFNRAVKALKEVGDGSV